MRKSSPDEVVDYSELMLRELECELELLEQLYLDDAEASELVAAAHEAFSFKGEQGLTAWQSVQQFKQQHPKDWERLTQDPRTAALCLGFDQQYGELFRINDGQSRQLVDAFDERLHGQLAIVAASVHDLVELSPNHSLPIAQASNAVKAKVIARVYDPSASHSFYEKRTPSGLMVATTIPRALDAEGSIQEDTREQIGAKIMSGPAFAHLLN